MDERRNQARGANEWKDVYGDMGQRPRERRMPIPIELLDFWQYPDGRPQPFTPYTEAELRELARDIEENGLNHSILVRPMPNGRFQVVAGEHRTKAHQLLGRSVIDATVRDMDDLTAEACMLSSNLKVRKGNKPSDTARVYKALLDVQQKRISKGQRTDLTLPKISSRLGDEATGATLPKFSARLVLHSDDEAAKSIGISGDTLRNYIRLLDLIKPMLDMVDDGQIPVSAGFELAYLFSADQQRVLDLLPEGRKISVAQAKKLRKAAPLTSDAEVLRILGIVKEKKKAQLKLQPKLYLEEPEILDIEKGIAELEFAAQKENPYAAYKLARILSQGELVPKDIPRAVDLLEGLKQDDTFAAQAAYQLAKIHLEEPEILDIEKGIAELEFAAQKENPYAAYKLARILSQGELVPKDIPRAVDLLEGLKQDDTFAAQAAYQLAKIHLEEPEARDIEKGIAELEFAAQKENPYAAYKLARILSQGELVAKDAPRAVALLESLKRDENFACQAAYQLGMLRTSDLTVWDMAKGIEDLQFAYAQGSHFAGCALGRIYLYGQGEYHDQKLGLEYLRDAAAQGNEYAAQTLEQVKAQEIKQETFAVLGLLRLFERSIKPSHQQQQKPSSDRYQRHKELEKKQAQGMNL